MASQWIPKRYSSNLRTQIIKAIPSLLKESLFQKLVKCIKSILYKEFKESDIESLGLICSSIVSIVLGKKGRSSKLKDDEHEDDLDDDSIDDLDDDSMVDEEDNDKPHDDEDQKFRKRIKLASYAHSLSNLPGVFSERIILVLKKTENIPLNHTLILEAINTFFVNCRDIKSFSNRAVPWICHKFVNVKKGWLSVFDPITDISLFQQIAFKNAGESPEKCVSQSYLIAPNSRCNFINFDTTSLAAFFANFIKRNSDNQLVMDQINSHLLILMPISKL